MVVILSGETLCRPWCVEKIVTAHQCSIPMLTCTISNSRNDLVAVHCSDYVLYTDDQLQKLEVIQDVFMQSCFILACHS